LEDAENVLHVRSGKIARVDRDVFAAVADWDLDQSNVCITLISLLLLLSRHDDRESFLNRNRSKVCCPRNRQQKHRRNLTKIRESKKEGKKTTKGKSLGY
jgi:hypothetical protein